MKNFGQIKSNIETLLEESYVKKTFTEEIKNFKKYVLENKNISKLFYLYDELNSKKGMNSKIVDDFINENVKIYENTVNKISSSELDALNHWTKSRKVNSNNKYTLIDSLFSTGILNLESKIESRNIIKENLQKKVVKKNEETINLPISTMIQVANKTIKSHIENLTESEKQELHKLLSENDENLKEKFETLKEEVKTKLLNLKGTTEEKMVQQIDETIEKVSSEKYDKMNYFKLKNLNENI